MKLLIWAVTGVVLLLGTLFVALGAAAADWLAAAGPQIATGAEGAARAAAQIPLPQWLALWIDPALLAPLQDMLRWSAGVLATSAPWLQPLLGWVAPLLWIGWAVVALLIVVAAGLLHVLAGKASKLTGSLAGAARA